MEDELVAAVGVFLPSVQLVVNGERDTFFKAIAGVGTESDKVTGRLESESQIKVFRDGRLGPILLVMVIRAIVSNLLYGRPS